MRGKLLAGASGLCAAAAIALGAPAADAGGTHYCPGTFVVDGVPYGFQGRGVGCSFIRTWSKRYQESGREPRAWNCYSTGYEGGWCHRAKPKPGSPRFEWYAAD